MCKLAARANVRQGEFVRYYAVSDELCGPAIFNPAEGVYNEREARRVMRVLLITKAGREARRRMR